MTSEDVLVELKDRFEKLSAPYTHKPSALLALLYAVQEKYGYISPESEAAVSGFLGVGANHVHEAVTFYTLYRQRPFGRYHIRVCRTLSCHITGAPDLIGAVERKLGIKGKEVTSDGLFSLEKVECLGCCDKAPAIQINFEPYYGPMTVESITNLIDELKAKASEADDA